MSVKTRVDFLCPICQYEGGVKAIPKDGHSKMGIVITQEHFFQSIRHEPSCLILNSRQSKRPGGSDDWVTATDKAVRHHCSQESLFLTSLGMNSWELTVHLVNIRGGRQIIVIPSNLEELGYSAPQDILREFRLDEARTRLCVLQSLTDRQSDEWPKQRDQFLIANARNLVPVSLRPSGRLRSLVDQAVSTVDNSFCVRYRKPVDLLRYDWSQARLNPSLGENWEFLTHWTRSTFAPFENQDRYDYYSAILNSLDYPGSARYVLERILVEKRIRCSSRFIRGGYRVVSLTEQEPRAALKLMRWRQRYAYYSFEPYGIAIKTSYARRIGCRPVAYGAEEEYDSMSETDRPFFQNAGSVVAEWRPEAEWRHIGDLEIGNIPVEALRVITYRESEVDRLQELCPGKVIALTVGD